MKVISIVVAVYISIVGVLAWLLPENDATYWEAFLRWFVDIPLFFTAWLALEWLGTKLLGLPFWKRMPCIARVMLLVAGIVVVIIAVIVAVQFIHEQNAL
jgi:ABC-type dipeptide/oligopeptide/nickel transport system permease subunit